MGKNLGLQEEGDGAHVGQAAHALVKADAGDALARDGDRTPEEIMELAKVIGEVVEIASGQKGGSSRCTTSR